MTNVSSISTQVLQYHLFLPRSCSIIYFYPGPAVLCIHGVFGSGKSYLLAVTVLILVRVLASSKHRILITSTTNVAVDNILIK